MSIVEPILDEQSRKVDVVIVGTGLTECMLGAALSAKGKKVNFLAQFRGARKNTIRCSSWILIATMADLRRRCHFGTCRVGLLRNRPARWIISWRVTLTVRPSLMGCFDLPLVIRCRPKPQPTVVHGRQVFRDDR